MALRTSRLLTAAAAWDWLTRYLLLGQTVDTPPGEGGALALVVLKNPSLRGWNFHRGLVLLPVLNQCVFRRGGLNSGSESVSRCVCTWGFHTFLGAKAAIA